MNTPQTSFRLPEESLRKMDKLLRKPTKGLMDPVKGVPRNRTELIMRLVDKELNDDEGKERNQTG